MQALRSFIDVILTPFRMLARIPSNVISSPRRMLGLPLPVRVALLLFSCLLAIAIIRWVLIWQLEDMEQYHGFFRTDFLPILILVVVIPCIVWYALKLWLEGEPSPYPDIEQAWDDAVSAMAVQSIDPSETPIFMVIGPGTADDANAMMTATDMKFAVQVPAGPGPLHVFANQDCIYVVCTESCCLGTLLGCVTSDADASPGSLPLSARAAAPAFDPSRTLQVGADAPELFAESQTPSAPFGGLRGTIGPQHSPVGGGMPSNGGPSDGGMFGGSDGAIRGTMMVGMQGVDAPVAPVQQVASPRMAISQTGEATARLAYLCRCIRRVRDPLCPINGVLVATPFNLLVDGPAEVVTQMQTAIKADLATLRSSTRIRCSVTHIVDGMEEEVGFRELVRRVGTNRAATQRFGKGFGLWNPAKTDQLDAVVKHACGAFEDWSYLLFREADGLSKRGNRHLYGLLCRIRSNFMPRLTHLIQSSYGLDPTPGATALSGREPLLFSGCYFVASGQTPDRQAFLASVFRKSREEEEELEWGSEALSEEQRMQSLVKVLSVLNGMLIAAIVAMLVIWKLQST